MSSPVYGLFLSGVVVAASAAHAGAPWWREEHSRTQLNKIWIQRNARATISPYHMFISEEEHTGDAWVVRAEEGRGTLRKAPVSRVQA
jgi:hypothetical protein